MSKPLRHLSGASRSHEFLESQGLDTGYVACAAIDFQRTFGSLSGITLSPVVVPIRDGFRADQAVLHSKHSALNFMVREFSGREGQQQRSVVGEIVSYSPSAAGCLVPSAFGFFGQQSSHLAYRVCTQSKVGGGGSCKKTPPIQRSPIGYPPSHESAHADRRERGDSLKRAVIKAQPSKHRVQRRSERRHPDDREERCTDTSYKFKARAIIHCGNTAQVAGSVHG